MAFMYYYIYLHFIELKITRKLFELVSKPFVYVLYNKICSFRFIIPKTCATFCKYSFLKLPSRPKEHTQYSLNLVQDIVLLSSQF